MTNQPILFQSSPEETDNLPIRMLPDFAESELHGPPANGQGGVKRLEFALSIKTLKQRPNIPVHRRMTDRNQISHGLTGSGVDVGSGNGVGSGVGVGVGKGAGKGVGAGIGAGTEVGVGAVTGVGVANGSSRLPP